MPLFAVIAPLLASAALAEEPAITITGYAWAPFVSPMGEPFRARAADDDPFARWFHQADRNRDGMLTADEMQADAERFFATLDFNPDGKIDAEERIAYEVRIAPEIQVNSRWRLSRDEAAEARSRAESRREARRQRRLDRNVDGYQMDGLQGAARYGLLNLPQPVAAADADFDRGITLEEFRRAALHRFQLLDRNRAGRLTLPELEVLLPSRPNTGRRAERREDDSDTRIGLPLPKED
jgi:Ca2+-binding EF-hand superfamily protein